MADVLADFLFKSLTLLSMCCYMHPPPTPPKQGDACGSADARSSADARLS